MIQQWDEWVFFFSIRVWEHVCGHQLCVRYKSQFLQEGKRFHKHVLNLIKSFIPIHFHLMDLIFSLDKKQENKYQYLWLRRLIIHRRFGPFKPSELFGP